ncbi:MAG: APC family permease [bacterium]
MQKKSIGLISATFLGVSSIIGSGWLFAPYSCAVVVGPGSIFCWIVGAIVISLLAMCFAEVAVLYPKRGLSAIIPTISHNKFFGFPFAIANWLGIIAIVALEAVATVQYLTWLVPSAQHYFYHHNQLTLLGNCLSILLVCCYCLVNYWGTKVLTKTNNPLSLLKITIPIITALVIIGVAFHPQNFISMGSSTMMPYGYKSVFIAILTTGIIISFNGFQTVISFSSEINNPKKTIPLSMLLAIALCAGIYLLLQISFIGGLPSELLANGWKSLEFSAPMVQLALLIGVGALAPLIYFGATIAPSSAAIAFTGSATNMSTAMANNQQLPRYFGIINPIYGVSRHALLLNTGLAIVFLFLFKSWGEIAQVLSLFHLISYLPIPIALCVFRDVVRHEKYSFFLPWGRVIAALLFVFFTYLFTMASLKTATDLMLMLAVFQIIFIVPQVKSVGDFFSAIKQCYWLLIYFITLLGFVWLSPNNNHLLNESLFNTLVISFGVIFFFVLSKTETGDVAIMDAAVNIYKRD